MNLDQKHWEKVGNSYAAFWKSKAKQEINKKELAFINESLQKTNRHRDFTTSFLKSSTKHSLDIFL